MERIRQHPEEGGRDLLDVLERQVALVELAVLQHVLDDLVDHPLNTARRWLLNGAAAGLDRIGEQQDPHLLAVRFRPGVAELVLLDLPAVGVLFLLGARVEVADQLVAVMGDDRVADRLRQLVRSSQLEPGLDVVGHDQRRHPRRQVVVRIGAALVLDEVLGLRELADVVVVAAHARQQWVGADRLGRRLGEVRHGQRVLERARRLDRETLEQRQIGVRQLEQADVGDRPRHRFQHRHEEARQHRGEHATDRARGHLRCRDRPLDQPALPEDQADDGESVDPGDDQPGSQEHVAVLEPLRHERRAEAGDQRIDGHADLAAEEHRDEHGLNESEEHGDRYAEHQPCDDRAGRVRQRRQVHVHVPKLLAHDAGRDAAREERGRALQQQHQQREQHDRPEPVAELVGRRALPLEVEEPRGRQKADDHGSAKHRERVERRPIARRQCLQQTLCLRRHLVAAPHQHPPSR